MSRAVFTIRATSRTWSQPANSSAMSVAMAIAENSTSAMTAKTTPGPASRVARQPPSNDTPVRITPIVAMAAPTAWVAVRDSPRIVTASTTVRPPYAATIPLTTVIGPTLSPLMYDR